MSTSSLVHIKIPPSCGTGWNPAGGFELVVCDEDGTSRDGVGAFFFLHPRGYVFLAYTFKRGLHGYAAGKEVGGVAIWGCVFCRNSLC